jgi:hypothetical protein
MDIRNISGTFTGSGTPYEYYPLGESHLAPPSDVDSDDDETLWDDDESIKVNISSTHTGIDIICKHQHEGAGNYNYNFRITDPSRLQIGITNCEPFEVPQTVRRILGKNNFYDCQSPSPNRLHAFDYLCSYDVLVYSSLSDRHPFLRAVGSALTLACVNYAQAAGIEASIASDSWPRILNDIDTSGALLDLDSRIAVARALKDNEEIKEKATIPARRLPAFIFEKTNKWPDNPPVSLPASRTHREPNTPAINVFSSKFEGNVYYNGIVMTRYGMENYRFKLFSSENREVAVEWPEKSESKINQYPPLELVHEITGRSITINNIHYPTESDNFINVLLELDSLVAKLEREHPITTSVGLSKQLEYRDLYGMALTLTRICNNSKADTDSILNQAMSKSEFPIHGIYEPENLLRFIRTPEDIAKITKEIADTIELFDEFDLADQTVKSLRWDPETLETS